MGDDVQKAEPGARKAWPLVMSWVGGATALIGLFASLAGGVTWLATHHKQHIELDAQMALAQAEQQQAEYQAAVQSYADILKAHSLYRPALDQQLNATMAWVENFSVLVPEGQDTSAPAAPLLDQIMSILDAGLTRSKGSQAADVQAHLGWAHWLNQHIAEREFGHAAEQNLRAALVSDPSNVYANAMLGNWMLQNGGSLTEAVQHFNTAVATGKARPFVRTFQLDGLMSRDEPGARAALIQAVNDMRKDGEPIDEGDKHRIVGLCCNPTVADHTELAESLSAVAPDEAWQTYLWLDDQPQQDYARKSHLIVHDFIAANLLELSGKQPEALEKYRLLQQQLKNQPGSLAEAVDAAIARLSHR